MKKQPLVLVSLVAAFALFAASCGDDDGGGGGDTSSPFVQAIVDDLIDSGDAVSEDRADVECYVAGIVDKVGENRLRDLGVTETNVQALDEIGLNEDEANKVVDALFDCVDTQALIADSFAEDATPEQASCLADKFDEDTIRSLMTAGFNNTEPPAELLGTMFTIMSDCGFS